MTSIAKPSWVDLEAYPFTSRFFPTSSGKMHYIDEGEGEVILFVHGTPTWSFLYREHIRTLAQHYRCIAIDHIGFGLSEKPDDFEGTPQRHSAHLCEFIERLDLKAITLVVHDFGGPIGLAAACQHPGRFKRIVLFNSWLWATKNDPAVQKVDRMVNNRLGRFLYLYLNFSPKVLLKKGFADQHYLTRAIHRHYLRPFPDSSSRKSLYHVAQALLGASDWYGDQWEQLHRIEHLPWLVLWGEQDEFITTAYLKKWQGRLPNAMVKRLNCGHFVQEECSALSIAHISAFMEA
jgi:haloalkane dehalogenase